MWMWIEMGDFKFSGSTTCYYKLASEDPIIFFNNFKSSLMANWFLKYEDEEHLVFNEGVLSKLKMYSDLSSGQFVIEVAFDEVRALRDLFRFFELLMKNNLMLCRLMLEINVINKDFFLRIANRVRKLRVKGLIEDSEKNAFRCYVSFRQCNFNVAFYNDFAKIEIITDLKSHSDLIGLRHFIDFISKKSIKRRLLDSLRIS